MIKTSMSEQAFGSVPTNPTAKNKDFADSREEGGAHAGHHHGPVHRVLAALLSHLPPLHPPPLLPP